MTTFIILAAVMALAASALIAWPLIRARRTPWTPLAAGLLIMVLSGLLYWRWSNWDWSGRQSAPDSAQIQDMVARLEQKLAKEPDDLPGWLMLGRSCMALERFDDALAAYDHALKLARGQDPESALGMGEAMAMQAGGQITPPAARMFELAVSLAPQNPKALLYGGFAAAGRGDRALARTRWNSLKALHPPPELVRLIDARLAELDASAATAPPDRSSDSSTGGGITLTVHLSPALASRVKPDSVLYLFASVPGERGPPLAVKRLTAAALGEPVTLSAEDSMLKGRSFEKGQTLQLTGRISFNGQPLPAAGDLYGNLTYTVGKDGTRELLIDRVAQ
jgi:cytochrome c-type biogenesis protein CcmH